MLKQIMKLKAFALAVLLAASCAVDGDPMDDDMEPDPDPAPQTEGVLLTDWVDAMVANDAEPDTVNDKPAIVINVDDPAAFDKYFAR
jgi:hypothetical protein